MRLYIITEGKEGPVKVGYSTNPQSRAAQLQTGNSRKLEVYETWDFRVEPTLAPMMENAFHCCQAEKRIGGEWFDMDPEEARIIMELYINTALLESGADKGVGVKLPQMWGEKHGGPLIDHPE